MTRAARGERTNKRVLILSFAGLVWFVLACSIDLGAQSTAATPTLAVQGAPTAAFQPTTSAAQPTPTGNITNTTSAIPVRNWIFNGDGELAGQAVATDDINITPPLGWTTTGNVTVVQYGAKGFADAKSPGPSDRGKNFFVGGPNTVQSAISQTIDAPLLGPQIIGLIDAGSVSYEFAGWLGGYDVQDDSAVVTADVYDATLGPVLAKDRANQTGAAYQSTKGNLPRGARKIVVTVSFQRTAGSYDDAYVDNLSFVLASQGANQQH